MSLKKLTDSIHKEAEHTKWSLLLISGNMTNHQYGQYLYHQLQIYSALESRAAELQIFNNHKIINNIKPNIFDLLIENIPTNIKIKSRKISKSIKLT